MLILYFHQGTSDSLIDLIAEQVVVGKDYRRKQLDAIRDPDVWHKSSSPPPASPLTSALDLTAKHLLSIPEVSVIYHSEMFDTLQAAKGLHCHTGTPC